MESLDSLALSEALRAYGVTAVAGMEAYFPKPHPLDELLEIAVGALPQPLHLLVSEQGAPEHFFLTGFPFLPVVFSVRHVALSEKVLRLVATSYLEDHSLRSRMAESIALETIAEFCLLDGNITASAIFFMKAKGLNFNLHILDDRSVLGVGADLLTLHQGPANEYYITTLLFGLAHEIGHAIQAGRRMREQAPPWCSDAAIAHCVETLAEQSVGDAGVTYREHGPSATLHVARLRAEAGADIEACRLLARATGAILAKYGQPGGTPDIGRLIASLMLNYQALGFINGCRRAASLVKWGPGNPQRAIELLQQPIAFATRQLILQDHLAIIALDRIFPENDPALTLFGDIGDWDVNQIDPELSGMFRNGWTSAFGNHKHALLALDDGLCAAIGMATDFFDVAKVAEVIALYRAKEAEGATALSVGHFMTLARSMGLQEASLNELASYLET